MRKNRREEYILKMREFIVKIKNYVLELKNKYWYKKSIYADFAPIDSISEDAESLKALKWALKNKKVKNIALTGPYGAGKSSVIESYRKQDKKAKASVYRWRHLMGILGIRYRSYKIRLDMTKHKPY